MDNIIGGVTGDTPVTIKVTKQYNQAETFLLDINDLANLTDNEYGENEFHYNIDVLSVQDKKIEWQPIKSIWKNEPTEVYEVMSMSGLHFYSNKELVGYSYDEFKPLKVYENEDTPFSSLIQKDEKILVLQDYITMVKKEIYKKQITYNLKCDGSLVADGFIMQPLKIENYKEE